MKRTVVKLLIISTLSFTSISLFSLPAATLKQYRIYDDSDTQVHALIKQGSQLVLPQPRKARVLFTQALVKVSKGAKIDKYDYLWSQYGLLKSSMESGTAKFGPGTRKEYELVARNVLKYLNTQSVGDWQFTEVGAFQMEVYREAGNGLAWMLMEDGRSLNEALQHLAKAKEFIRGPEDYYMYDTEVRILLKLKRKNDAFKIVKTILTENPNFSDFQDVKRNKEYILWLKTAK